MNLRQKILALSISPLILAIVVITLLVTYQSTQLAQASISTFERNMLETKEKELLNLTNMAVSAIIGIYENAGPDDAAAKQQVQEILSSLDYGEDGYFFVYDYNGVNIVHPRQSFRKGVNWLDLRDPEGNRVIYNLIQLARNGGGLLQYKWQKPSSGEIADKVSFAVGLDKWQWMLGTGVYLDDVYTQSAAARAVLRSNINRTFAIVAATTLPLVFAVFLASFLLTVRERRLADTKLQQLTHRIIETQEEERTRIARELHDGISQSMVAARYMLDLAANKVRSGASDALDIIDRGAKGLNGAIQEVRRISHNLRPGILDDLGLSAALEALVSEFSGRTGIETSVETVAFKNMISPDARTALYRVAQEALTNIERHAGATVIHLTLRSNRNGLELEITDNGRGLQVKDSDRKGGGLGLRNMQERMELFGGGLEMKSAATGTTIIARLPKSVFKPLELEPQPA